MKRIWIFALLAVFWFCIAASTFLFVDDLRYLMWVIFLPPSLAIINAARPRRGLHYVYWNRYIYVFGVLVLGGLAVPFLVGYLSWWIKILGDIFPIFFPLWLIGFPLAWFLWFKFYFMPSWGPWRLRKRYPRMVAAASRLKKFGESYLWYFPLLFVQDKPYLVVGYSIQGVTGLATLDEEGRFVKDEALALTLLRCYKLAMAVLHMPDSQTRAKDIDSYERTDRQMQRAFQRLRENEAYFRAAGQLVYERWKTLCLFEPIVHAVIHISIDRKMWQAQWAIKHGLNKLTEVSDKQLSEAEGSLATFNRLLADQADHLNQIGADAEELLKYVQGNGKSLRLKHRGTVEEMLKSLILLRQGAVVWQKTVKDFLPLDNEWSAWQGRKYLAEKLEVGGKLL